VSDTQHSSREADRRCADRAGRGGRGSRAWRRATRGTARSTTGWSGATRPAPSRPKVSMLRGTAFQTKWRPVGRSHHKRCVGRDEVTAQHIVRLYRVLRGRAVSRGSASSASRSFSARTRGPAAPSPT